jgi:hypothetical protein
MLWLAILDGHLRTNFKCPHFYRYIIVCFIVIHSCKLINLYSKILYGKCAMHSKTHFVMDTVKMHQPYLISNSYSISEQNLQQTLKKGALKGFAGEGKL